MKKERNFTAIKAIIGMITLNLQMQSICDLNE